MINHREHREHGGVDLKDWREQILTLPDRQGIIIDGEEVDRLVFGSVDDLRTQIKLSNSQGTQRCLANLQVARQVCLEHGYKTKAKILAAAIKKQEVAK
jgi:hypothetical protein